jgi:succinylglutamate desuccinylase
MFPESIIKKIGELPGPTVAVFGGIHGNEKAGMLAISEILNTVQIIAGTVYFVFANPPAIEKDTRLINLNLNRLFDRKTEGSEYEVSRAHELMDILDTCDALLDLHSYNSDIGEPFVIAEANANEIIKEFDVEIVAEGFGDMGYGTDDYMFRNGKIGICLECGTSNKYQEFVPFAVTSVKQFLNYFGCTKEAVEREKVTKQKRVRAKRIIYKKTEDFKFSQNFLDFETLPTDKPFIVDGSHEEIASVGEIIMFPRAEVPVGGEVCIIGELI